MKTTLFFKISVIVRTETKILQFKLKKLVAFWEMYIKWCDKFDKEYRDRIEELIKKLN